jgi:hypothetical protein
MKKIFAILALMGVVATGAAQNTIKAGLYDKHGLVLAEVEPVMVNVTLRVVKEQFKPGKYARYAQKCLGTDATYLESSSIELVDARLALGEVEKPAVKMEASSKVLPLPSNVMSKEYNGDEEQAAATAELIFSLRKSRLDLITGEAGENVFGAGLKAALDEIARLEKEYLDMFYGGEVITEEIHTFNITITPDKNEYMVCRFSDKVGIVEVDDLSGKPIVVKVETEKHKEYPQLLPLGPKDKVSAEYIIVPQSKCSLIGEATLMDSVEFASQMYGKRVTALPIK